MKNRIDSSSFEGSEVQELEKVLKGKSFPALVDSDGKRTELPKAIFNLLVDLVDQIKKGRAIQIMPEDETFTTQAGANFLGVSRQHLVDLLEEGEIDFHYVGTHRRIKFKDLVDYKDERDGKRRESLDKLFQKVSDAGKYDSGYVSDDS